MIEPDRSVAGSARRPSPRQPRPLWIALWIAMLAPAVLAAPGPVASSAAAALDLSLPRSEAERPRAARPELLPTPPSEFSEWEKPKPRMPWQPSVNLQSSPICGNGHHGIPAPGPDGRQMYRCD